MHHDLVVCADAVELASSGAAAVVEAARSAIARSGEFTFAVSGGTTPRAMFAVLADRGMPWDSTTIYQVDERMAPAGDPDRNLTHLTEALAGAPARILAMPVEDPDPETGARAYARQLPDRLDLVHLGLGSDGHTASLVPGDTVLDVVDRAVALTGSIYQGHRRMTLTYPALARAGRLLWLISGASKADALSRLLTDDTTIPAGRVHGVASTVMADRDAVAENDR